MQYSIQQLASLAGISVRTLHYYDQIGLLVPSRMLANGYRQYSDADSNKLKQILFFKELEFSLDDIGRMMESPLYDIQQALEDQKTLLLLKKQRIEALIQTIEQTQKSKKGGTQMKKIFSVFSNDYIDKYKKEVEERWRNTEAYKQSQKRTKDWTKEDYLRIKEQTGELTKQLADAMKFGYDSKQFQSLVGKHHKSIEIFYDCPLSMYRSLGQMYVDDQRFTAFYDNAKKGLAICLRDGIAYYCDQRET